MLSGKIGYFVGHATPSDLYHTVDILKFSDHIFPFSSKFLNSTKSTAMSISYFFFI